MPSKGLFKGKMPKGVRLGGRQKGTTNKFTATVKDVFESVFVDLQKDKSRAGPSLKEWARRNPGDYYKIAAKLMPHQITGDGGGPVQVAAAVTVYLPENGRRAPVGAPELAAEAHGKRIKIRMRTGGASS